MQFVPWNTPRYKLLPAEEACEAADVPKSVPFNEHNVPNWLCYCGYVASVIGLAALFLLANQAHHNGDEGTRKPFVKKVDINNVYLARLGLSKANDGSHFVRPPEAAGVDCARIIANDTHYISSVAKSRIIYKEENDQTLPLDCPSIRSRNYFPNRSMSDEEKKFPVAFARIVYKVFFAWKSQNCPFSHRITAFWKWNSLPSTHHRMSSASQSIPRRQKPFMLASIPWQAAFRM